MGLDMYLTARITSYKGWDDASKAKHNPFAEAAEKLGLPKLSDNLDSISIEREVGYWRKANQIHKWFVDTVQNGKDECQESHVSIEQLRELYRRCIAVRDGTKLEVGMVRNGWTWKPGEGERNNIEIGDIIVNPEVAQELLPTGAGFFFGSTDYDQWYMHDINATIEMLTKIFNWVEPLVESRDGYVYCPVEFYYQASW